MTESQTGKSGFQKLLEPQLPQLPRIAPYRVVLGNVKDKVLLQIDSGDEYLKSHIFGFDIATRNLSLKSPFK